MSPAKSCWSMMVEALFEFDGFGFMHGLDYAECGRLKVNSISLSSEGFHSESEWARISMIDLRYACVARSRSVPM